MPSILIATRNLHKVQEIQTILGSQFPCLTLADFPGAPTVAEDAVSFAGNAIKKAVVLAEWLARSNLSNKPEFVLADDSGLEVDALNGAPGVHSARFAALDSGSEGNSPDSANNLKLLGLLADTPAERRTARFRCVIAFTPVPAVITGVASPVCAASEAELGTDVFDGACEGRILDMPRGANGFGYDPLFVPTGFNESFAELGEAAKNRISHRSKALEKLRQRLQARTDY
jgi:XTP/dITP diphosphohydrolase